jgi:hypothetical protein
MAASRSTKLEWNLQIELTYARRRRSVTPEIKLKRLNRLTTVKQTTWTLDQHAQSQLCSSTNIHTYWCLTGTSNLPSTYLPKHTSAYSTLNVRLRYLPAGTYQSHKQSVSNNFQQIFDATRPRGKVGWQQQQQNLATLIRPKIVTRCQFFQRWPADRAAAAADIRRHTLTVESTCVHTFTIHTFRELHRHRQAYVHIAHRHTDTHTYSQRYSAY